jgi:hypothetical protein
MEIPRIVLLILLGMRVLGQFVGISYSELIISFAVAVLYLIALVEVAGGSRFGPVIAVILSVISIIGAVMVGGFYGVCSVIADSAIIILSAVTLFSD